MPMILPLVAIAAAAVIGGTTALVIGTVVAVGLTLALSQKSSGIPSVSSVPGTSYQTNPQQLTFSNDAPRRRLYGKARVSGIVSYANVAGDGYQYLYMVVVIAAHKITDVTDIYFDGDNAADVASGFYNWWWYDGTQTTADPELVATFPEYTADCILQGCAYAVVKLTYDKTVYKNGRPNIQFDVKGAQCYDPRTGTSAWTNNAALCVADFLTSPDGLGAESSEMDWDSVSAAADISAQIPDGMQASLCDGRYTIDGVVELTTKNGDTIDAMLSACAGTVVWSEGVYRLYVGAARDVQARAITAEDLRDAPTIQPNTPSDQSFNCVSGTFMDSVNGWVMNDFPPVVGDAYVTEDGGVQVFKDIVLQFTTSPLTAQRLANIFLRRARLEGIVTLPCKWTVFNYEVWDVISLNLPQFGWISKQFQITDWKMTPPTNSDPGGIDLQLQEYNADAYSDDMDLKPIDAGGTIQVPDVTQAKALPTLTATSGSTIAAADGTPRVRFDWPKSTDVHTTAYELAYGHYPFTPGDADYIPLSVATLSYMATNVTPGDTIIGYVRTVNSYNNRSTSTASNAVLVTGIESQYPEDVSGLTDAVVDDNYHDLSWAAPIGKVSQTEIRFSPNNTFADAVTIQYVDQPINSIRLARQTQDGTYYVRFVNTGGMFSPDPASVTSPKKTDPYQIMVAGINQYDGDITGGVWKTPTRLIPDSTVLASAVDWEVFDNMVYSPVTQVTYWTKKKATGAQAASFAVNGNIGQNRAPGVPGTPPLIAAQAEATFADESKSDYSGAFTMPDAGVIALGAAVSINDPQGIVINGGSMALTRQFKGLTPYNVNATANSYGDVRIAWDVAFDIVGTQYDAIIFDPGTLAVIWQTRVTAHEAFFPIEESVPIYGFPPTQLSYVVKPVDVGFESDPTLNATLEVDDSWVDSVVLFSGDSRMAAHFTGGSGSGATVDVQSSTTFRNQYATRGGLQGYQVVPINGARGSAVVEGQATPDPADNYFWDVVNNQPGPNAIAAVNAVKATGKVPKGILWMLDNDSAWFGNTDVTPNPTPAGYMDALLKLFAYYRAQLGAEVPIYIARVSWGYVGEPPVATWPGAIQQVGLVEATVSHNDALTFLVSDRIATSPDDFIVETLSGETTRIHFTPEVDRAYATMFANACFDQPDLSLTGASLDPATTPCPPNVANVLLDNGGNDVVIRVADCLGRALGSGSWHVQIMSDSDDTVLKRDLGNFTTNDIVYSNADCVADWGFVPSFLNIRVSQIMGSDESPALAWGGNVTEIAAPTSLSATYNAAGDLTYHWSGPSGATFQVRNYDVTNNALHDTWNVSGNSVTWDHTDIAALYGFVTQNYYFDVCQIVDGYLGAVASSNGAATAE